jgi:hypothetical protein
MSNMVSVSMAPFVESVQQGSPHRMRTDDRAEVDPEIRVNHRVARFLWVPKRLSASSFSGDNELFFDPGSRNSSAGSA